MPQRPSVPALTANQARYILEKLIDDGAVTAADVRRHLAGMWEEMNALERRIAELRGLAGAVHPVQRVKATAKRARKVTAEVLASRKLQGQYIAYLRQVPRRERRQFAEMAKQKGREEAIRAIKSRLGKNQRSHPWGR